MRRVLPLTLLCAGAFLSTPAFADDNCIGSSSDTAVSFPDGSYDYVFVVQSLNGGYNLCFYSPTTLDMSAFSYGAVADLNHDGWLDLIFGTKSSGNGTVDVFLNDKSGSGIVVQTAALSTGSANVPAMVQAPDLDGDGRPDILTGNGDGTLSVMLNGGSGTFSTAKQYNVSTGVTAMAAVDLNGDNRADIVTTDPAGYAVEVLMNTGAGDFATAAAVPVGASPYRMQVVDLNHDGFPDIVTENNGGSVSVLLNNQDGTFSTAAIYTLAHPSFLSIIDTNNDGHPDIVTDFTNGAWYALVNNGDGTFAAAAWVQMPGGSSGVNTSVGGGSGLGSVSSGGTGSQSTGTITYTSGSGKVTGPAQTTTPKTGVPSAPKGSSAPDASGSSGGGAMEWLSLMLLGIAGLWRRKRA